MVASIILSLSLVSKPVAIEQSTTITDRSVKVVWMSLTAYRSSKEIRTISASDGYTLARSDGTNCFAVSRDALVTCAERKGVQGVLVIWRSGGSEFLQSPAYLESVSFFDKGGVVGLTFSGSGSDKRTILRKVRRGLPKLVEHRGTVLECSDSCAIVAVGSEVVAKPIVPTSSDKANVAKTSKIISVRNSAVAKIAGTQRPVNSPSELRLSPGNSFLFDAGVDESTAFNPVALSCVSGLFDEKGQVWEWRSGGRDIKT